jgi:hypothetical protein
MRASIGLDSNLKVFLASQGRYHLTLDLLDIYASCLWKMFVSLRWQVAVEIGESRTSASYSSPFRGLNGFDVAV